MKRILILILTLSLLIGVTSCGKGDVDYVTSDMTEWFDLLLSEFTGGTYDIDLPDEVTDEDVDRELRYLRLYYATHAGNSAKDTYLTRPEFTDVPFFFYDVALTPDGESVFSNLFSEDGTRSITIGLWEFPEGKVEKANPLFDNKTFSDALTQTLPVSRVTEGVVQAGDIVTVDYTVYNEKNVADGTAYDARIDTSALEHYEGIHPQAILSALVGKTIGEEYTTSYTFLPEGATEEITYTYDYTIRYKSVETFSTVAITLDENAFDETYNETLQAMNGKTVYVRYIITRFIDYDPPELNSSFYIDTLGLDTEETDVVKIEQEARAKIKDKLSQTRLAQVVFPLARNAVFNRIFERDDRVKKLPEGQVTKVYNELIAEITSSYEEGKGQVTFPYKDINDFAAAYLNYDIAEYPTLEKVCRAEAEAEVTLRLLYFTIAQLAGIRYTPERCEEYYLAYLKYQIIGYTKEEYGISLSDEEREKIHRETIGDETDKLYEEFLHLLVKHYAIYEQISTTVDDLRIAIGSKEDFLLEGLMEITEVNVQEYLYENNTWNDTTP